METIQNWMSKDDRYINMIRECEIIRDAVAILGRRTIGEGEGEGVQERTEEEEEVGVSVREKTVILRILSDLMEGGGWNGDYEELKKVVNRLEEEGKKEWEERKKDGRGGKEWKDMERLAREVGWAIGKNSRMPKGRGGDREEITLDGMKGKLEEEKKGREEENKRAEEAERRRDEEMLRADEEKKRADNEKRRADEEKRKKEEAEAERNAQNARADALQQRKEQVERREILTTTVFVILLLISTVYYWYCPTISPYRMVKPNGGYNVLV